jgi:hypothetical protein
LKDRYPKWREECTLFLDDSFDCPESRSRLSQAGYAIECFSDHFLNPDGTREQGVGDERILNFCNSHGYVLVTTDSNIIKTHRREIARSPHLGILATAHNTVESITPWVESLVKLRPVLARTSFRARKRPWFGKFDRNGKITSIRTVTLEGDTAKEQAG